MKTCGLTLACLLCMTLAAPVRGQEVDLATRVAQLEKRVAELEAALKRGTAELAKTDAENKLVGSWTVTEADRKSAVFNDLVLKADGTCEITIRSFARPNSKYKVIGKQLIVEAAVTGAVSETWGQCRVVSVSDKELVLEHGEAAAVTKVKYNREK